MKDAADSGMRILVPIETTPVKTSRPILPQAHASETLHDLRAMECQQLPMRPSGLMVVRNSRPVQAAPFDDEDPTPTEDETPQE